MRKEDLSLEKEPVFIGKIIEEELRRQERTVTWLSRKIHCDRRNVYDIFSRAFIDTNLLWRISKALDINFFEYYSSAFQCNENQRVIPPPSVSAGQSDNILGLKQNHDGRDG